MRTKLLLCALACSLGAMYFSSCDNDDEPNTIIWDVPPFYIYVTVSDQNGIDLLDPGAKNSIADNGITMIYNGEVYEKDSVVDDPYRTRMILPTFYGLQSTRFPTGRHALFIGEFSGDRTYDMQDLVFDWGDGSKRDTVTFDHRWWTEGEKPFSYLNLYVNHQPVGFPDNYAHIIKQQ